MERARLLAWFRAHPVSRPELERLRVLLGLPVVAGESNVDLRIRIDGALAAGGADVNYPPAMTQEGGLPGWVLPLIAAGLGLALLALVVSGLAFSQGGPQGPQGVAGETGAQGPEGKQGIQGLQGPAATPGPAGKDGAAGAKGDKGDIGSAGARGPEGPKGDKGDQGLAGPQGSAGAAGAPTPNASAPAAAPTSAAVAPTPAAAPTSAATPPTTAGAPTPGAASGGISSPPGSTGIDEAPADKPAEGVDPILTCVTEDSFLNVIQPSGKGYQWESYPNVGYKLAGSQGIIKVEIRKQDLQPGGKYEWIEQIDIELHSYTEASEGDMDALIAGPGTLGTVWIKDLPEQRYRCITTAQKREE